MAAGKVKILLDADVIIHFAKGDMLAVLPTFLPGYEFCVLNIVKQEVHQPTLSYLERQMAFLHNITELQFGETAEERKEFARLTSVEYLGRGESACMVYCRYHNEVVGSSNLRDILNYCKAHAISYLTTTDFLYYGIKNGKITKAEADEFIAKVNASGSRVPVVDFDAYMPNCQVV